MAVYRQCTVCLCLQMVDDMTVTAHLCFPAAQAKWVVLLTCFCCTVYSYCVPACRTCQFCYVVWLRVVHHLSLHFCDHTRDYMWFAHDLNDQTDYSVTLISYVDITHKENWIRSETMMRGFKTALTFTWATYKHIVTFIRMQCEFQPQISEMAVQWQNSFAAIIERASGWEASKWLHMWDMHAQL